MNRVTLATAIAEAERFLDRARPFHDGPDFRSWEAPKETGSIRRASMDLTRALADLRRAS